MLAGWVMFVVLGNEIRFADEIRPLVGLGHRDATLLRTRYVDQRGVRSSAQFWAA